MTDLKDYPISLLEVIKAKSCIKKYLNPPPLISYKNLSRALGCQLHIKHENHNITGSFKIRGGINIMSHIKRSNYKGVVTFSTGNHGLSVATSAKLFNIPAIIVVPKGTNPSKIALIKDTGAEVIEAGENFDQASLVVNKINQEKGYYYVHPANEPHIINGVGTEFLEIIDTLPNIDAIILPLGGGSEVASAIITLKALKPEIKIYAVQAEKSSAAYHSWKNREIINRENTTFAGGFATGTAYETTFNIYKDALTDFILLSEDEIMQGVALAAHYTHNLVEGAGGSTIMAAWKLKEQLKDKNVVIQFSGANASVEEIRRAYALPTLANGKIV